MRRGNPHFQQFLAAVVLVALLLLAWQSSRSLEAAAQLTVAERHIEAWSNSGVSPVLADWSAARDQLVAAQHASASPLGSELLGVLHGSRFPARLEAKASPEQALIHFREAVTQLPTSPFAWANLLTTKYELGQVDAELFHALRQAVKLGPREPRVQVVVTDFGLALWEESPADVRALVEQSLVRGSKGQADVIRAIAMRRGRLGSVCQAMPEVRTALRCAGEGKLPG